MALAGSGRIAQSPLSPAGALAHIKSILADKSDSRLAQIGAGKVFVIRIASALLALISQILFARWMGQFQFGIYVYVWTWVLLIGQSLDLGLATAALRFVPQYRDTKALALLRGFLAGSRVFAVGVAIACAAVCAGLVTLLRPWLDDYTIIPLYIACMTLPAYALANVQDGIARSYDWVGLGIVPTYIARQLLLTLVMAAAYFGGFPVDALTALILAGASIWLAALGQLVVLNRRLGTRVTPGPKAYEFRTWLAVAMPILMVESFYLVLTHTDVLVLQQFRSPSEVAIYFAATKTLALVAFVYFAVAATVTHRFSAYHVAGDREGLATILRQSVRWTFWPSLAATVVVLAFGKPLLWLFGAQFGDGYHLMFILALGLLARASIGPVERLLNMLGEQRICATVYCGAFVINLGLCMALIPRYGATGAAIATAIALCTETALLSFVTRRRLGLHVFIWSSAAH
ncbi:MAG TPA: lipopolysaccharide biosynthesis protein [Pseudolabrys sp.]|nr:lipopolysaccharide biosynthesis protein [Pseudolabrys sp.]